MTLEDAEKLLRQKPDGWWDVLVEAIPELKPLSETEQSSTYHQEGNVASHTRLTICECKAGCDPDLLWSALLHDIGKPATTKKQGNKITAYKHEHIGSIISDVILTRLRMDKKRKQKIIWAVKNHLFYHSWQLSNSSQLTRKQINFMCQENFTFLLDLIRVDSLASKGVVDKFSIYGFYKDLWDNIK